MSGVLILSHLSVRWQSTDLRKLSPQATRLCIPRRAGHVALCGLQSRGRASPNQACLPSGPSRLGIRSSVATGIGLGRRALSPADAWIPAAGNYKAEPWRNTNSITTAYGKRLPEFTINPFIPPKSLSRGRPKSRRD